MLCMLLTMFHVPGEECELRQREDKVGMRDGKKPVEQNRHLSDHYFFL